MINMHLFLIGMAGAGKTSLGSRLARSMNMRFVDTDTRVSELMGMTIPDIFASLGEPFFRAAETAVLTELAFQPPAVVSTGGGIVTVDENIALMKNHGLIIHIDRPLDRILSDIRTDRRPMLSTAQDVIELYDRRIGTYHAAADYRFNNTAALAPALRALTELTETIEEELEAERRLRRKKALENS